MRVMSRASLLAGTMRAISSKTQACLQDCGLLPADENACILIRRIPQQRATTLRVCKKYLLKSRAACERAELFAEEQSSLQKSNAICRRAELLAKEQRRLQAAHPDAID